MLKVEILDLNEMNNMIASYETQGYYLHEIYYSLEGNFLFLDTVKPKELIPDTDLTTRLTNLESVVNSMLLGEI